MSSDTTLFSLHAGDDYIELYKVLKVQGLSAGGGEAKHAISEGLVTVNGEIETRKRKKLVAGDRVCFKSETIQIVAAQ